VKEERGGARRSRSLSRSRSPPGRSRSRSRSRSKSKGRSVSRSVSRSPVSQTSYDHLLLFGVISSEGQTSEAFSWQSRSSCKRVFHLYRHIDSHVAALGTILGSSVSSLQSRHGVYVTFDHLSVIVRQKPDLLRLCLIRG
jgi:hypothetical protein